MQPAEVLYPVTMLSVPHILFLAILIPLAAFLAYSVSKKYGFIKAPIVICTVICVLCEIEKLVFFVQEAEGGYRLPPNHLPFNMCPFQVILMLILSFSDNPKKFNKMLSYMYPAMVGGGFIGMMIPSAANYYHGLLQLATYRYFFFHAVIIFMGFYLYFSKPIQYNLKSVAYALVFAFLFFLANIYINAFFGWDPEVNHMFAVRPPLEGLPFLNLDRGWPLYIFWIMLIAVLLIFICYIKVIIKETPALFKSIRKKIKN